MCFETLTSAPDDSILHYYPNQSVLNPFLTSALIQTPSSPTPPIPTKPSSSVHNEIKPLKEENRRSSDASEKEAAIP